MASGIDWPEDSNVKRSQIINAQGLRLPVYTFEAKVPRATVILVHGIGVSARHEFLISHSPGGVHTKFEGSFIDALVKHNVSVVAFDQQSMGEADGISAKARYYFDKFDDLAVDLLQLHKVTSEQADRPTFWLGISMGGAVCARAAQMDPVAAGLVLLAPMLSLTTVREEFVVPLLGIRNRHLYPVMNQLSSCIPQVPVVKKAYNPIHPHLETELLADPLNNSLPVRVRVATEFVLVTEAFMASGGDKSLEQVSCKELLLVHALADQFVEPQGSVAAFARMACTGSKTLLLMGGAGDNGKGEVPRGSLEQSGGASKDASHAARALLKLQDCGMWHALTQEPGNAELGSAIAVWICERVPKRGLW